MGTEQRVSNTFQNYRGQIVPSVPGLLHWAFYGSMGSGNQANQAPGGPPSTQFGTVTQGPNYVTEGQVGTFPVWSSPINVSGGQVVSPTLVSGGSNYNFVSRMVYTGGGGSGASDVTTIGGGQVTGLNSGLKVPGSGYTTSPSPSNVSGNMSCIDTGIPRSQVFSGGWTIGLVCRIPGSGAISIPATDAYDYRATGFNFTFQMQQVTNSCKIVMFTATDVSLTLPSSLTNWRFFIASNSGGAAPTLNLYSMSDAMQGTPYVGSGSLATFQQMTFGGGPLATGGPTTDIAFTMMAAGPLSYAACVPIYNSVKSVLANRGLIIL
jgi:hypothetical protein